MVSNPSPDNFSNLLFGVDMRQSNRLRLLCLAILLISVGVLQLSDSLEAGLGIGMVIIGITPDSYWVK